MVNKSYWHLGDSFEGCFSLSLFGKFVFSSEPYEKDGEKEMVRYGLELLFLLMLM